MSLDKSLRLKGTHIRHRNVLSRGERLERLTEEGRWTEEEDSVFGLPKVRNIMVGKKKKVALEKTEGEGEGKGTETPTAE